MELIAAEESSLSTIINENNQLQSCIQANCKNIKKGVDLEERRCANPYHILTYKLVILEE
jgi:hypothetical protein